MLGHWKIMKFKNKMRYLFIQNFSIYFSGFKKNELLKSFFSLFEIFKLSAAQCARDVKLADS